MCTVTLKDGTRYRGVVYVFDINGNVILNDPVIKLETVEVLRTSSNPQADGGSFEKRTLIKESLSIKKPNVVFISFDEHVILKNSKNLAKSKSTWLSVTPCKVTCRLTMKSGEPRARQARNESWCPTPTRAPTAKRALSRPLTKRRRNRTCQARSTSTSTAASRAATETSTTRQSSILPKSVGRSYAKQSASSR